MTLQAGDVLLYKPKGFYGWLIRVKTWHAISHCEIAWTPTQSAASRDGIGVGFYPTRTEGLAYVLRPKVPFNVISAEKYIASVLGSPYGWADLLNFLGVNINTKGIVCSPFVTEVLRAGGVPVFNMEKAEDIAPFQFLTSELLADVTCAVTA